MNFVGSNVGSGRKSASAVIRLKSMHKVVVVVNCIVIFDQKFVGGDALLYERIIFIKAYDLKAENKLSVWPAPGTGTLVPGPDIGYYELLRMENPTWL